MFTNLNDIRLLVTVVRQGSITKGALALNMPKATVSRRLSALEREVRSRLIERHSRHFELTAAGKIYHAAAARALEGFESASAEVAGVDHAPAGHLRIAAPAGFAAAFLAQPIASFLVKHPQITLDLNLSPQRLNLIPEDVDVAVRLGALEDSSWVSHRLATLKRSLYASPAYVKRSGLPESPEQLTQSTLLSLNAYTLDGQLLLTRRDRPSVKREVTISGRVSVNSMTVMRHMLLAGAGIGLALDRLMEAEVRAKRAVRVLSQWQAPALQAHALFRSRALLPLRVRLFIDHLAEALHED